MAMNCDNALCLQNTPVLMPKCSRYRGIPVDFSVRRSIVLQSESLDGERVVFDNFFHEGRFWRATLALDAVADVYGQSMNFARNKTRQTEHGPEVVLDQYGVPKSTLPILNHLQTRFVLEHGETVDLYPLGGDTSGTPIHRIDDFIYSLEAVGPTGIVFGLRDAYCGNLIAAHRFLSTTEMVFERIVVEGFCLTESPALPLSKSEKRAALWESLKRSHAAGDSECYYLFRLFGTNNCTSNPFQIVDHIRPYTVRQRLGSILYRLPLNPRWYLKIRGLDSDSSTRRLLKDEFAQFINDPATQLRKRTYTGSRNK